MNTAFRFKGIWFEDFFWGGHLGTYKACRGASLLRMVRVSGLRFLEARTPLLALVVKKAMRVHVFPSWV